MSFPFLTDPDQPLFAEPSADIDYEDLQGFFIGGVANLPMDQLGQHYFDAANKLIEISHDDHPDYSRISNPVLYLYRHSIELFLKAILKPQRRHHSLDDLATEFEAFIKEKFDHDVPDWITGAIRQFDAIDASSTAFRYNEVQGQPVDGEYWVDLDHLQKHMTQLTTALVGVIAHLAIEGEE